MSADFGKDLPEHIIKNAALKVCRPTIECPVIRKKRTRHCFL